MEKTTVRADVGGYANAVPIFSAVGEKLITVLATSGRGLTVVIDTTLSDKAVDFGEFFFGVREGENVDTIFGDRLEAVEDMETAVLCRLGERCAGPNTVMVSDGNDFNTLFLKCIE